MGTAAGMATYGLINNATNAIYYNFISDGESTIGPESYNDRYISRWERLDYTKQETKEDSYNLNAWRYQSEYAAHMYAWYVTGWAYEKDIPIISNVANSAKSAGVDPQNWDTRGYVKFATVVAGVLGV